MRTADELRGSSASLSRAANRSSGVSDMLFAIALSLARFAANCFTIRSRLRLRHMELVFAISLSSVDERQLEAAQERLGLFVALCGGDDDDVHAAHRVDLVVIDFRKHKLFLEAERVIAAAVEALRREAAEVAAARCSPAGRGTRTCVRAAALPCSRSAGPCGAS